jgi:hypothetical protein
MPNRARMLAAYYLTRGLGVDRRNGTTPGASTSGGGCPRTAVRKSGPGHLRASTGVNSM